MGETLVPKESASPEGLGAPTKAKQHHQTN